MQLPQKRSHRRRRSPREGHSRRRRGEDGASLSGSLVESDSSSSTTSSMDEPPSGSFGEPAERTSRAPSPESLDEASDARPPGEYESRYHEILASRLAELLLREGAADLGPDLPSDEIVEALVRPCFYDDELRAALVEYQAHKLVSGPDVKGQEDTSDSGEFDSSVMGDISVEDYLKDGKVLMSRQSEIDTETELGEEEVVRLHHRYARYRIKACLLLKGKPVDDFANEDRYPTEHMHIYELENAYYLRFLDQQQAFGWYFDPDLCLLASLTDYQRLVLCNEGGDEYENWSLYREIYSTPEADRQYLLYWDSFGKNLKWLEHYAFKGYYEWVDLRDKAVRQAHRIAIEFPSINLQLASYGIREYIVSTHSYVAFLKDLDTVIFEIWKLVKSNPQMCFRDALEQVYADNKYPLRKCDLEYELKNGAMANLEYLFRRCTKGIHKEVPDGIAQELISQEVRFKHHLRKRYVEYARKKLRIAEVIGLIPKEGIPA